MYVVQCEPLQPGVLFCLIMSVCLVMKFDHASKLRAFGWWTAEKKELMGSVHELQLLPFKIRMQENMSNLTYNQADDNFKLYWFKNYLVSNHNNLY